MENFFFKIPECGFTFMPAKRQLYLSPSYIHSRKSNEQAAKGKINTPRKAARETMALLESRPEYPTTTSVSTTGSQSHFLTPRESEEVGYF